MVQKVLADRTVAWVKPTATDVSVPTTMQVVDEVRIPLTDVNVPKTDEHFGDVQEIRCLNRLIRHLQPPFKNADQAYVEWEPDPRHVEILLAARGVDHT